MAFRLIVYTSTCCVSRGRHIGAADTTRTGVVLPQPSHMRQVAVICACMMLPVPASREDERVLEGLERVTEAGEGCRWRVGCGSVLDDQRSHWPCDEVCREARLHLLRILLLDRLIIQAK